MQASIARRLVVACGEDCGGGGRKEFGPEGLDVTDLDKWDVLILAGAAFVAVTSLVRLMLARRDELVKEVQHQIDVSKGGRKKKREETQESE